jgi:hypothetical protein
MAKILGFTAKATFPVAACFLAASLMGVARAGDKAQLTGHWNFNQDQSDDAEQKVHEAQLNNQNRQNNGNGGGYPGGGGGYPGGGGGYPGGGGGIGGRGGMGGMGGIGGGGMGRGGRQGTANRGPAVSSEEWDRLADNPKYLRIDHRSDQVVVLTDSDQAQTFYPDGKKHDEKDSSGKKFTTKANWEGDSFIAETKLSHSQKLTQTFRVSQDGKQLYVVTRFEDSSLAGPVSIRRVYDLGKSATN